MQRKLPWARWFIALSAARNINKLNIQPFPFRRALEDEELNKRTIRNMSVFNGIKAVCTLYIMLASSFLFTWYSYLANPAQIEHHKNQWAFLIVYCAVYTAPLLFLVAGFLQTFEFMQQPQDQMFSAKNLARYYAWRLTKFVPLLGIVLLFSMYVLPFAGSGPIWAVYEERVMLPCNTYWWTVLAQVNNIYPTTGFDDKCMPWAWFIPALTQLSLLLPIFVAVYQAGLPNRFMLRIIFALFLLLCCLVSGGLTFLYDHGAMPVSIQTVDTASGVVNSLTVLDF